MTTYVFISYKRENEAFAIQLSQRLREWNYDTWRDSEMIPPDSSSWADEIQYALENSHTVIGVMTEKAMQSENVKAEWDWAIMNGRHLMLLWIEDCRIHHQYIRRQRIDFRGSIDLGFERLKAALKSKSLDTEMNASDPYSDYIVRFYNRIRGLLKQTLLYALAEDEPKPIQLKLDVAPEYVSQSPKERLDPMALRLGVFGQLQNTFDDFHTAFKKNNERVLLLGSPGAGKTTTLLHYALTAAVQRKQDPTLPLPIMNLITTWDGKTDMVSWLQDSFDAPADVAGLLSRGEALLLMDGLDELGSSRREITKSSEGSEEEHHYDPRQRFLSIIPSNNKIIITSRISDYEQIGQKVNLCNALVLHSLSDSHLDAALAAYPALLQASKQDIELRELMKTPLIMALFAFAYDDIPSTQKQAIENLTLAPLDMRDELVLAYIRRRYKWEEQRGIQLEFKLGNIDLKISDGDHRPALLPLLGQLAMEICGDWRRFGNGKIEENVIVRDDFDLVFKHTPEMLLSFQQLALRLNILQERRDDTYGFVHLYLRDALAYSFCKVRLDDQTLYGEYPQDASPLIAFGVTGRSRVVNQLGELLGKSSIDTQRISIEAIAHTKSEDAITYLLDMLQHDSKDIRSRAVSGMIKLGGEIAVEGILRALRDNDWRVRSSALNALGDIGGERALQAIYETVNDPHPRVRSRAIATLGKIEGIKAQETITRALNDDDWSVRRSAVSALTPFAQSGSKVAINSIIQSLHDIEADVRSSAIDALGQIGGKLALQGISSVLDDEDLNVSSRAISELEYLTADKSLADIVHSQGIRLKIEGKRVQDEDPEIRRTAIRRLGQLGESSAIQLIMNCLNDEHVMVRRQAIHELRELRAEQAIPDLINKLQDEELLYTHIHQRICDYAAYALEQIGTPEAIAAVKQWRETQER